MSDPTDYYRSIPPLSVYDPDPESARRAALYVASRCAAGVLSLGDARTVLAMLGLMPDSAERRTA